MEALSLRLSITSTNALIGIQTQPAQVEIEQKIGDLSVETEHPQYSVHSQTGTLQIDSSAAWAALGRGSNLALMSSIYSQSIDNVKNQIAVTVLEGNEMAAITNHSNAFANIAARKLQAQNPISYLGDASVFNVKMNYDYHPAEIDFIPGKVNIQFTPNPAQIAYNRGKVNVFLQRPNSIDIRVTEYGLYN